MTTATKTIPSKELAQLERERDRTYAELQKVKRTREAFDAETWRLRAASSEYMRTHPEEARDAAQNPKPGTKAAELHDEIRERRAENPHTEDYESAKAAFHEAGEAVETFRTQRLDDLIAEAQAEADDAIAHIVRGFEQVAAGCGEYRGAIDKVTAIIGATPGLARQPGMDAHDPRINDWAAIARDVFESEIAKPGLSDRADDGWIGWPALPEEEQDPTVEDLKQRAASLRGEPSTKQERDAELVDLMHTGEGEEEQQLSDDSEGVRASALRS